MNKKIVYVAELNLPNDSAYSIHVMKMCESFASLGYEVSLYVISLKNIKNIFSYYNVNHKFNIKPIFERSRSLGFFARTTFSIKTILRTRNNEYLFLSRSIVFAIYNTIINRKTILELHHKITGITGKVYYFLKILGLLNKLDYIFLHKNLLKSLIVSKNKFLILDDAVNLDDFNNYKNKKYNNTAVYVGSFYKGKGTDFIAKLAKTNPKINFHLYGKTNKKYKIKNLKLNGFRRYRDIPKILSKYDLALMPYSNIVLGKSSIELQNYMSPLKMFEYMASKKIILATDLKIYKHILKNNFNCKLLRFNDLNHWSKSINNIFKNIKKYKYLGNNAYQTVQQYTWNLRAKKILAKFCK